jgi:hypothetical protein
MGIADFIREHWLFLAIVFGMLMCIIIVYVIYVIKNHRPFEQPTPPSTPSKVTQGEPAISLQDLIDLEAPHYSDDTELFDHKVETNSDEEGTGIAMTHIIEKTEVPQMEDNLVHEPTTPISEESLTREKPKIQKADLGPYHVLFRKEDRQWFVKREGSDKVLRVLPSQREAIAFATIKALTQNESFIIHNQDGSIKKR